MWNPYFASFIIPRFSPKPNYVLQKKQSVLHKELNDFAAKNTNIGSVPNNYVVTIDLMDSNITVPHQVCLNRLMVPRK